MRYVSDQPTITTDRDEPTSDDVKRTPAEQAVHEQHGGAHDHAHDPHLAHHYDTPQQQYEAAKFGMWLFIATEFLLFGGLFVAYAVYRGNNPDLFQYSAQFLSTTMGAINTVVLILSSMTIAFAVRCAQLNQQRGLVTMLALTLLGGAIFMGIKYVEYSEKFEKNLVWGIAFYDPPEHDPAHDPDDAMMVAQDHPDMTGDPEVGRNLWMQTCLACHGQRGRGVRGQAPGFHEYGFVEEQSDEELLAFIKRGRMPFDPASRTGVQMPPKGGNPLLTDDQLKDIVAFIRTLDLTAVDAPASKPGDDSATESTDASDAEIEEFYIVKSSIPLAGDGPDGLADDWEARSAPWVAKVQKAGAPSDFVHPRDDPDRPANIHHFFGIYFLMTGLHGLHVLIGMGVISVLVLLSWKGRFTSAYYTPVELTGLYWHVVDVIWIFLFPLFYLIH